MNKETQKSLIDFLQDAIPELQHFTLLINPNPTKDPNAQKLYDIWADMENKVADRKFLRPPKMSRTEVSKLESSGLVEVQGKYLKVTAKGVNAIKSMILHHENSSFEKSSSIKSIIKTAQKNNVNVSKNWYIEQKNKENM